MTAALDQRAIKLIARKLQAGHAKETTGEVTPWLDLDDEERKLWLRLAKRAVNEALKELAQAGTVAPRTRQAAA